MTKSEFIVHAIKGTSYWDGIEIMLSSDGDSIYHRHVHYDENGIKINHQINKSMIKYTASDKPYFMRYGNREYLDNYIRLEVL